MIRVLPENLANQIAAGEVVERPASVIKELLENAVDAGARNISVQVEGRAVGLLRVSDDGAGMDGDDLLLALERHATSKVVDAQGLAAIGTLGFRGEALPSIASVSRLLLSSRPAEADLGALVEVRFGAVRRVQETGAARGTVVEVRDLFANVPARRKFLKSPRTELYHVEECVKNCGLAFPGLGVHYQVDGRTVLQWPAGVDDAVGRVRRLLGKKGEAELISVAGATGREPEVSGLLLAPEETPATGARLRLFVNGRPVRDRMLSHAVAEGLHHQLLRGRLPAGVLYLQIDPATVDVNVHPTKQEIRFQRPDRIHDAVREAVGEALARHERQKKSTIFGPAPATTKPAPPPLTTATNEAAGPGSPATPTESRPAPQPGQLFAVNEPASAGKGYQTSPVMNKMATDRTAIDNKGGAGNGDHPWEGQSHTALGRGVWRPVAAGKPAAERMDALAAAGASEAGSSHINAELPPLVPEEQSAAAEASSSPICQPEALRPQAAPKLLGQVLQSYIICATSEGLLAVDQHAAHERLLYERLLAQYNKQGLARQALLFPAMLECSPAEAAVLESRGREISRLGLTVEPFGGNSYVIKAVPALLASREPTDILAGVLARYLDDGAGRGGADRLEAVLAGMACKAAVKAGQALDAVEMEALLREMQAAGIFSRCPHGRPVARHFTANEMARWFKR
ncbi:DNA mismatch repair endonuclease MutL [Desulfurivibrio dismutans]|uniref:DNA mismatch repair endonuclease MutL n=1 Tax=Desulfurivibrio dismutans TaxID=1398908 RepID=UPI0023DACA7B|nr:DNA mismatch repair endonuclease MutL [Desulfurivibrio alkaliphilus]MDF1613576.1 DNA mismatch repair endonuclease MutL [Desulfurivibrio alkaliphilus]